MTRMGRYITISFIEDDLLLLSLINLPRHVVTNVGSSKLLPQYIVPFRVFRRKGNAYTIDLPHVMRTYSTFYVMFSAHTVSMIPLPTMEIAYTLKNLYPNASARAPDVQSSRVVKRPLHSTDKFPCVPSPARQRGSEHRARSAVARPRTHHGSSQDQLGDPCGAAAQCRSNHKACRDCASNLRAI